MWDRQHGPIVLPLVLKDASLFSFGSDVPFSALTGKQTTDKLFQWSFLELSHYSPNIQL